MSNKILNNIYNSDIKVPRYTSYPTVPNFQNYAVDNKYDTWLGQISPNEEVSLYIHIPFCKKLCWFCGCNTKVVNNYELIERYLELLKKEIQLVADKLTKPIIKHIHFGGGSPTIISPTDFLELVDFIKENFEFSQNAEIAIEVDPRNVSEAKIASYVKSGVNRISIGIQDFNHKVQESINRIQPFSLVYEKVKIMRDYGINNINTDLIYGLPNQDMDALSKTIELTLMLNPNRIALFGYAHVPWMKKHQKLIDESVLADIQTRIEMVKKSEEILVNADYIHIGLDHFAKKEDDLVKAQKENRLKRNFQGYTSDDADILVGLGISSIGSLSQGYIQNTSEALNYSNSLNEGKLPVSKIMQLSEEDKMRRDIIFSLMCYMQVDLKPYGNNFKEELNMLQPFVENNIIEIDNSTIKVSKNASAALRIIASVFDEYLKTDDNKHSLAV